MVCLRTKITKTTYVKVSSHKFVLFTHKRQLILFNYTFVLCIKMIKATNSVLLLAMKAQTYNQLAIEIIF